ncbi:MAG: PaaI family thioesterase [Proteobacteria bacterium]|nr:PaaI family thioesterase [Pseudomonadota bacterium]
MKFNGEIEFTITEKTVDHVTGEMPIQAGILNPFGTVHAGAIIWFADVAATVLVLENVEVAEGMKGFPLAINLNANLMGNGKEGMFFAQSKYVKRGKAVSIVRTVVTDNSGRLIAEITTSHVSSK